MQPKHSAIVAGLTLALSFGAVSAPAPAAAEEPTPGVASDATDIDKGLYTQQSFSGVLRSVQGVSFVNVTPEMKYFTKYESHGNYNQGFSYGDGYNALGYYQFDRRWSLIPFMKQAYNYNPEKYCMLKDAIDRGSEISNTSNAMYENGQLTELGHIAQDAFQGAYNTDPAEFSALQDAYAYNSYYAVTEAWLKSALGIDISGRADCVKGMVWSITNMCGTGGCRDFFRWANLSNDMSDREFVTALSNSVVNNVATKYASQPQYHEGWKNRYRNELKDCLVYIAEDEAAAAKDNKPEQPEQPEPAPEPAPTPDSNDDPSDDANDDRMDAPSTDADGGGSAGDTTNDGSTLNGSNSNGSAAGDSSSSSVGNTDSDASGSTDADTSNSSTGSSDSSIGTGSNNGSGSDATPDSDASKDDSNKAPDAPVASPDKKPSFSVQLGSTLGSSLMAGVNNGSTQNKDNSDQVSMEKTEAAKGDSKDKASEKAESDKGPSSDEKGDKSGQKKDESKTEGEKKQSEDDDKSGADNQVQEQNDSKTVTTTTTTTTTTKSSGGNMPKTGDLIVMASLASASLATLGATSIVSGKHKLDQQKKASGEDGSEE
ncbi:hypothetical protein PMX13_08010 [Collinsella aerofaciens]|uniref:VgrG-related protein n=1 Tax=Collinsella aerofaciens TaxID=74426 RepID=UPI00189C60B3|nr:hypothetical protein [Collinsella aerofaciens]MDB1860419.1 hypothetical protein [Collinsella aerofaciens]